MRKNASKSLAAGLARYVAASALVLAAGGCARGPNVASDLPLRRVVVYRNGVAYFERAGSVDDAEVRFRMRGEAVGDFLATLAIVERGGGSVRSASFPIEIEDREKAEAAPPPPPCPFPYPAHCPPPPPEKGGDADDDDGMKDVVLALDGKEHDLSIGYVAETPVWRPSYRVVVRDKGQADLQTWGIVQNLSGEDWSDVELVLVAGAPIAFQSSLGVPVVPARPVVTDSGEVIAAVPTGETTYAEAPPPPPAPAEAAPAAEVAMDMDEMASSAAPSRSMKKSYRGEMNAPAGGGLGGGGEGQGYGFGSGHGRLGGAAAPAARPAPSMAPRNVSALAAVALEGGTTRYALPSRVNVPDESATMVLLLHQGVPGSAVHLFAPDPGVPDSSSHPFRVVRFTNATPGMLERGPIAVFEKGSFLGEGMLDPLPPKATATVPFALERGLAIQSESRYQELGARVALIQASELTIERDQVHETRYRVQNGGADATRLLVKHPRMHGARLHSPPAGTEDNLATMSALVPVDVAAYGKAELLVDERTPVRHPEDWLSDAADLAVKAYLADARSDAKVVSQLGAAWVVRDKLRDRHDARARLATEQSELERSTHETRLALKSLEKNTRAADLVSKLTDRLRKATDRLDQITKEVIEVDLALRELEVRFRDAIREIALGPQDPGGGR